MLFKLLISGLTGVTIISLVLLSYGFNPVHNEHWLISVGAISAAGTFVAELINQKQPRNQLKKLLRIHSRSLSFDDPEWRASMDLLQAMKETESWKNGGL